MKSSNTKDYKSIRRNTRRMNRLEELGRVDAEKAFTKRGSRNLRDEKRRIVSELKKADGGEVKRKRRKAPSKTPGRPAAPSEQRRMGIGAQGARKKEGIKVVLRTKEGPAKQYNTDRVFTLKKDGGKVGGLKKVQPHQKGLKKLPTKVRNKMGYMKKGGRVGMGKAMRGGGCVR